MNWESKAGERDILFAQTLQTGCETPVAEYSRGTTGSVYENKVAEE
jgi:hypothetical protein